MTDLVGIGTLIGELTEEFPDVTVSKVRFLEAQGLVTPIRTPSGYRRYSAADRDRLRYVLTVQRDHFLPLKVIREHLDAMERGLEPPDLHDPAPQAPQGPGPGFASLTEESPEPLALSRAELLRASGLTSALLEEAEQQGLISPGEYDRDALDIARTVAGLADYGLTPRHLRAIRLAAEREIGLIEQVTTPMQALPDADERMRDAAVGVATLAAELQSALVRAHLAATIAKI